MPTRLTVRLVDEVARTLMNVSRRTRRSRFARAAVRAVKEGKLLYREAYDLTGLYGDTFDKFAARLEQAGRR